MFNFLKTRNKLEKILILELEQTLNLITSKLEIKEFDYTYIKNKCLDNGLSLFFSSFKDENVKSIGIRKDNQEKGTLIYDCSYNFKFKNQKVEKNIETRRFVPDYKDVTRSFILKNIKKVQNFRKSLSLTEI